MTLADLVLAIHLLWVLIVIGMVPAVILGNRLGWSWIRLRWVRYAHLAMITLVTLEALFHIVCPLTWLEHMLRGESGQPPSLVAEWVRSLLFYDLPPTFFTVVYLVFLGIVLGLLKTIPPNRR